jgi:hypothetical protein
MQTYFLRALEKKLDDYRSRPAYTQAASGSDYDWNNHNDIWNNWNNKTSAAAVDAMWGHFQILKQNKITSVDKIFSDLNLPDLSEAAIPFFPSTSLYRTFRFLDLLLDPKIKGANNCLDQACNEYDFLTGKKEPNLLKTEICFSADPWDIATMSMRGIDSCMSWKGSRSANLIGSIVDPCCAVIYLTNNQLHTIAKKSGSEALVGTEMLARSVVRYVLNEKGQDPSLLLERLYIHPKLSSSKEGAPLSGGVLSDFLIGAFSTWLEKHSSLPVEIRATGWVIPQYSEWRSLHSDYQSCRDSGIQYSSQIFKTLPLA